MDFKERNGIYYLTSTLLKKAGIPHAFASRRGGVSTGAFDSLNMSTRRMDRLGNTDKYENTVENFTRVLSLVDAVPESSVCANQVHGNRIITPDKSYGGMGILKGAARSEACDGLFLPDTEKDISAICVKGADCTPVLLADARLGSVAAVHSGWRGTCLDIVGEAVRTMVKHGSRLSDIYCAVGPCIGSCCYEVSEDVYNAAHRMLYSKNAHGFISEFFKNRRETQGGVKYNFDIGKMCAFLAYLAGVPAENIDFLDICTCCYTDKYGFPFFSHRRQGGFSGTCASVIAKPGKTVPIL